jgi:hypothetical protein
LVAYSYSIPPESSRHETKNTKNKIVTGLYSSIYCTIDRTNINKETTVSKAPTTYFLRSSLVAIEKNEVCLNKCTMLAQDEKLDNAKSIVVYLSLRPENYAVSSITNKIEPIAQKPGVYLR